MKARDLMTSPALTIAPDATVEDAVRLMIDRKLSGLPVVDAQGRLVGMVTEGDLLRRGELGTERKRARWIEFLFGAGASAVDYARAHGRRIHEVMTDQPVAIAEDAELPEIVDLMEKRHIKRLPVTREGAIVGIVARADLIRGLAQKRLAAAPASDREIRERIIAELAAQKWAPVGLIGVDVEHGEVRLSGAILDERAREAIRIVAENTAGVTKVHDALAWVGPEGLYVEPPPDTP